MPKPPVSLTEDLIAAHERLFAEGVNVGEACAVLKMSTATYYKWGNAGEFSEEGSPCREFYERVVIPRRDAPRKRSTGPRGPRKQHAPRKDKGHARLSVIERDLDEPALIGLLESLARGGNVRAIQLLLERPWEKGRDEIKPESEFDALDNVAPIRRGA